jgi:hypothetical protein
MLKNYVNFAFGMFAAGNNEHIQPASDKFKKAK